MNPSQPHNLNPIHISPSSGSATHEPVQTLFTFYSRVKYIGTPTTRLTKLLVFMHISPTRFQTFYHLKLHTMFKSGSRSYTTQVFILGSCTS
ncbi:hypothetical protein Hanom_Chr09g00837361 [Helianthus anomalus]